MNRYIQLFCAFLLLLVISYTTAHKSWIRLSYEINKLEIIEKFCVNKEVTKFQCDGKCHLKTQLAEADQEDAPKKANFTEENSLTLFYIKFNRVKVNQHIQKSSDFTNYQNTYKFDFRTSIFHPPKA